MGVVEDLAAKRRNPRPLASQPRHRRARHALAPSGLLGCRYCRAPAVTGWFVREALGGFLQIRGECGNRRNERTPSQCDYQSTWPHSPDRVLPFILFDGGDRVENRPPELDIPQAKAMVAPVG